MRFVGVIGARVDGRRLAVAAGAVVHGAHGARLLVDRAAGGQVCSGVAKVAGVVGLVRVVHAHKHAGGVAVGAWGKRCRQAWRRAV